MNSRWNDRDRLENKRQLIGRRGKFHSFIHEPNNNANASFTKPNRLEQQRRHLVADGLIVCQPLLHLRALTVNLNSLCNDWLGWSGVFAPCASGPCPSGPQLHSQIQLPPISGNQSHSANSIASTTNAAGGADRKNPRERLSRGSERNC